MIELIFLILGYIVGYIFLCSIPKFETGSYYEDNKKISVIIPARNEASNISNILSDLNKQTRKPDEIICIDDESEDDTAALARSFGAVVISVSGKPDDWAGKSWACQCGGRAATGEIFLFIDADVRLSSGAIQKLINTFNRENAVLSVQPFHMTEKVYEQCSFFFNLVLIAGNGAGFPFHVKNAGLFGPVIFIEKDKYELIGEYVCAKSSVVEDLALGDALVRNKIPVKLFWGDTDFRFRMYNNNFKDIFQGWSKNFASGAARTSFLLKVLLSLWFYSCTGVAILFIQSVVQFDIKEIMYYSIFYIAWVIELLLISRWIGNFKKAAIIFYPVILSVFLVIFAMSIIKKVFNIKTVWKGRKLDVER